MRDSTIERWRAREVSTSEIMRRRQGDVEGGPLIGRANYRDRPPMQFHQGASNSQPQATALGLPDQRMLDSEEFGKELLLLLRRQPDPGVLHGNAHPGALCPRRDGDAPPLRRVLVGVRD